VYIVECRVINAYGIEQDVEGSGRGPVCVTYEHFPREIGGNHKSVRRTDPRAHILTQCCHNTKQDCYRAVCPGNSALKQGFPP
jgi:hypothetical protein